VSIIGLDLGHASTKAAEHWLAKLPPVLGLVACTHLVPGPRARVVITLDCPDDAVLILPPSTVEDQVADHMADQTAEDRAVAEHTRRRSGRAVIYPGVETLTGQVTVTDLLTRTAISRIHLIGGTGDPLPQTLIDTRSFVRPQWMDGQLTLVATPAPDGRIAPFEVPNPTPCCADHALASA
jgi:hypothetical protein